jgi:hypothetical protein
MKSDPRVVPFARRDLSPAGHEEARLIRENRALRGVALVAVCLLGPAVTAAYLAGRRAAPMSGTQNPAAAETALKPPVVNSPAPKPPIPSSSRRAESAPAAGDNQSTAGQVYLQLFATNKPQDAIRQLRRSGFEAFATEVPQRPGLYRVFIGPLPAGEVSKTRADLQSKGFRGPPVVRSSIERTE